MPYLETRTNIPIDPAGGYVTVVVDTTIPQVINFGLVMEAADGTQTSIESHGRLRHPYMLGSPSAVIGAALICYGQIVDPNHGRFEVHCDFFQGGNQIKPTPMPASVGGQLSGNYMDFGIICSCQ